MHIQNAKKKIIIIIKSILGELTKKVHEIFNYYEWKSTLLSIRSISRMIEIDNQSRFPELKM
jgi:hypothetical protein